MTNFKKNDCYFGSKFSSHKMSEYKFWVVKDGQLHLFLNPHQDFEPDSSHIEWGELLDIHFHDDENTTWKDYQEEDEEEDNDYKWSIAHPPYRCDGGCGKIVGSGNDDECDRICDDCKEEEEAFISTAFSNFILK